MTHVPPGAHPPKMLGRLTGFATASAFANGRHSRPRLAVRVVCGMVAAADGAATSGLLADSAAALHAAANGAATMEAGASVTTRMTAAATSASPSASACVHGRRGGRCG
jgi:hypothetical protein